MPVLYNDHCGVDMLEYLLGCRWKGSAFDGEGRIASKPCSNSRCVGVVVMGLERGFSLNGESLKGISWKTGRFEWR